MAGCCECGDEPYRCMEDGVFLDYLTVLPAAEGVCSMEPVSQCRNVAVVIEYRSLRLMLQTVLHCHRHDTAANLI
jgi:hypothetical protein